MTLYEFNENNSGGSWWLRRADYDALFAAGWKYEPSEYDVNNGYDKKSMFGGEDDVPYGWRHGLTFEADSIQDAVESWEAATGANFFAGGCSCCGSPFSIDGGEEYASGGYEESPRPW
jgi:hypothetical protein